MARPVGVSVSIASVTDRHQGQGAKAGEPGTKSYYSTVVIQQEYFPGVVSIKGLKKVDSGVK